MNKFGVEIPEWVTGAEKAPRSIADVCQELRRLLNKGCEFSNFPTIQRALTHIMISSTCREFRAGTFSLGTFEKLRRETLQVNNEYSLGLKFPRN
jgi:hypothetical protein